MHINGFPHSKRLNNQQQKVERVSVQHTVNRHKRSQKLIRHLVLWPLSQISECLMDPACNRLVFLMSLSPLRSSSLPPPHPCLFYVFFCLLSHLFFFFLSLWLSDIWEHDLVELVLEVGVSQVSHRQRDMLLRQVGVLLGVLDSDIIVREISAFNEHR